MPQFCPKKWGSALAAVIVVTATILVGPMEGMQGPALPPPNGSPPWIEAPPIAVPVEPAYPLRVACHSPRIIDGDTFGCLSPPGTPALRLLGIDAPEKKQPGGLEATAALESLLSGPLTITATGKDLYGRYLVRVSTVFTPDIAESLVSQGMAWVDTGHGPVAENLARAQEGARTAGLGIWGQAGAVPPKQWRQRGGVKSGEPVPA